ncbi:MAG: hypothetical protein ACOYLI_08770 [Synechococcus lacustris]
MARALRLPPFSCSIALALLPLLGALVLWRSAKPHIPGDLRLLLQQASLVQSLPVDPRRPLPELWRKRLPGPLATKLWREGSGPWLQFWGIHADGAPALVLRPSGPPLAVANGFQWGPYLVVSADPLSRQSLQGQLQGSHQRLGRLACGALEGPDPAVYWRSQALGAMAASWAPLLQPFQEGCLRLQGQHWWGETTAESPLVAQLPGQPPPLRAFPSPAGALLQLEGRGLAPLLDQLLATPGLGPLLRQRYGLTVPQEQTLLHTPFRLSLRPNPANDPYRASLWLRLQGRPGKSPALEALLKGLTKGLPDDLRLEQQGSAFRVLDAEGQGQAGWRRLPSGDLLLVLGGSPQASGPGDLEAQLPLQPLGAGIGLRLRAQPKALAERQLLPPSLPPALRQAGGLKALWRPLPGGASAQVSGALSWDSPPASKSAGAPAAGSSSP